ncbi:ABC transporter ATP-binding protein [Novosphingopyxis sp.]|uniref:ABC transporter ATP-binding protein n=1 Tax=Novosphingopyxis sp. TaxID=2709690 RepID=UPI003B5A6C22
MANTGFKDAIKELVRHLPRRRRQQFWVAMGFMLAGAVAEVATIGAVIPFLSIVAESPTSPRGQIIRELVAAAGIPPDFPLLYLATALLVLIAVGSAIVRLALIWILQKFIFGVGYDIGTQVYRRTLYRPYSFHIARNSSDIVAAVNMVQIVINSVLRPIMLLLTSGFVAVFIIAGLLIVDAFTAMLATASFVIIYVTVSFFSKRVLRANSKLIAAAQIDRVRAVQEGMGGIRDVILDRSQPVFIRTFAASEGRLRSAQATNNFIGQAPRYVVEASGMIVIALLALYFSARPGGVIAALPTLGALAIGAQRLMPLVQQVYNGWTTVHGNSAITEDVIELLEEADEVVDYGVERVVPMPFDSEIGIRDLTFQYADTDRPALDGLTLSVRKGERIGVIGKTGSGKSTFMDLLMALLDPTSGEIRIDGKSLTPDNRRAWQAQVVHVPQSIFLTDSSMAANIAFGQRDSDIDEKRLHEAARKADIHNFIMSLPRGYDTPVGERGVRISGGQRQRIGIARALYKGGTVMVLDEATSALDDQTETAVMDSIAALGDDLTIFMIAHRLSTVRHCDRIVRIAGGKIVAVGTYQDVVEAA